MEGVGGKKAWRELENRGKEGGMMGWRELESVGKEGGMQGWNEEWKELKGGWREGGRLLDYQRAATAGTQGAVEVRLLRTHSTQ